MSWATWGIAAVCALHSIWILASKTLKGPSFLEERYHGTCLMDESFIMAADDESPGKARPSTRRWSMDTERRVQVSESLREMFQALPQMMTRRNSGVISASFGTDTTGKKWQCSSVHTEVMLEIIN